ncbi:MAG: TylF/MycF/NovP-related O-methyltransferase [Candidatus Competibacter sp.]
MKMYSLKRIIKSLRWLILGTVSQRRRVCQELARISANLFGDHYIGDDHKIWRQDKDFIKDFRRLSPHNYYSEERKYTLREFVRFTAKIPGDLAECGCYVGVSAWFMAEEAPNRKLFLFDSFEGLSAPDLADSPLEGVQEWQVGDLKTTEDVLRKNLAEFNQLHIFKGWIPKRFQEVAEHRFCLVHIDVDLYQPTLDSLKFFYPRLSPGGVIVMDDYGFLTCPGATKAAHEFMADKPEYILHLPTGQGIIIRQPHDESFATDSSQTITT